MKTIANGIIAFLVIFNGFAFAGENYIVNSSEDYKAIDADYVHDIATAGENVDLCTSTFITQSGECDTHGDNSIQAWADGTFFVEGESTDYIPDYDWAPNSGYHGLNATMSAFLAEVRYPLITPAHMLSNSLPYEWMFDLTRLKQTSRTLADWISFNDDIEAFFGSRLPDDYWYCRDGLYFAGAASGFSGGGTCEGATTPVTYIVKKETYNPNSIDHLYSTEKVDQKVINYIKTGDNFAQNFTSQLTFGKYTDGILDNLMVNEGAVRECNYDASGRVLSGIGNACTSVIVQHLDQGDTDLENLAGNAQIDGKGTLNSQQNQGIKKSSNTFQQRFMQSGYEDWYEWSFYMTQNIEQTTTDFFWSCASCAMDPSAKAFSAPNNAVIQSWTSVEVPTLTAINSAGDSTQTAW